MSTVLISGANRGIGLEFARQSAADGWTVIGTARHPDQADALRATGAEVLALDIADAASIAALAQAVGDRPIDLLFANAGIYGETNLDPGAWLNVLRTNAIGPTLLAEALRKNVARSDRKRMVAVTSGMGSIAETGGAHIPYRTSKAALNMAWKNLAIEYAKDGITVGVINPGWVQTDMGGPGAAITPTQSVTGMRRVIAALTPADTGRFLSWDAKDIAW
ncbi:SDR family oxidoreductase [Sphingomonas antarctica]|uniref:SDR family oxidoreductase n=1 Tax=Sphingomonas antarctica TaxID=2040274 RepID=UPI0039E990BE